MVKLVTGLKVSGYIGYRVEVVTLVTGLKVSGYIGYRVQGKWLHWLQGSR